MHFELVDAIDVGDERVMTVQRIVGRFRLTGIEVDHVWGAVVSVRQGKIASAVERRWKGEARGRARWRLTIRFPLILPNLGDGPERARAGRLPTRSRVAR